MSRLTTLFAIILMVAVAVIPTTGCPAIGVPDPQIRLAVSPVVEHLLLVYTLSESPAEVRRQLVLAKMALDGLDELSEGFTSLDKAKLTRLQEGVQSLLDDHSDSAYVRQRAKSLAALAASLGLYNDPTAIDQLLDLLDQEDTDGESEDTGTDPEGGSAGAGTEPEAEGSE